MKKLASLAIAVALAMNMGATALADDGTSPARNTVKPCDVCLDQAKTVRGAQTDLMKLIFSVEVTKDQIADAAEKFINARKALKTCTDDNNVQNKCRFLRGKKIGWMKLFGGPKWFWFGK